MLDLQKESDTMMHQIQDSGIKFSCKENCGGCCHVQVTCLPEEIERIVMLGADIDMGHLKSQVEDWDSSNKNCVFLKDGNCSIHDHKPLSCVSHLVDTPSANCSINSKEKANLVQVRPVEERLSVLRREYGVMKLHEGLYNYLMN